MRPDFIKVLTERPRSGGRYQYKKFRHSDKHVWRADEDAAGGTEGMRRPYKRTDYKEFNDLLGPLYRYVASRVGKPWNKTYKEVCVPLKGRNTVQQHLLSHLMQWVEDKVWINEEGRPRHANGTHLWKEFYVDPRDGVLKKLKKIDERRWRSDRMRIRDADEADEMKTKEGQVFRKVDGLWFEVTVIQEEVKIDGHGTICWHTQNREVRRQLGTHELRQRGLINEQSE